MREYENGPDLTELLDYIDPCALNYGEWLAVGMGLKESGYGVKDWDDWSRRDGARYHDGECAEKWESFRGCEAPVTGGTIVRMAKEGGWRPGWHDDSPGYELDWDCEIRTDGGAIIDPGWVERREVIEPGEDWKPEQDLIRYLKVLFESDEYVSYVTESYQNEKGEYKPKKGFNGRTAGELIEELSICDGDIGAVLGDYDKKCGVWVCINPMDGQGRKKENVTDYRYALVESDVMELDKQNAFLRELELPIACLVYSGGKSLHAVVRIEAADEKEYRKRVDYLYKFLQRNKFVVDTNDRNASRLSRLPGAVRNGHKQFLLDTNIGKGSWQEWQEWIESVNDDLPDFESLTNTWDKLPELSPPLIDNVLRKGHKMLLAGPSKAGKSFALIELCIAIAEGRVWLGKWLCARGRVLYVNLELDRASCLHRFRDVYQAKGWAPLHLENLDIWNLRGYAAPMDKLAPKLIRRAMKKNYLAVIIDPIYKIITGDENSADQMAAFCNQFDRVCTELGAAVIYCHHHSKGSQGQKRSMDRASGSGVFARDPDALLDLIELEVTDTLRKTEVEAAEYNTLRSALDRYVMDWEDRADGEGLEDLRTASQRYLSSEVYKETSEAVKAAQRRAQGRTAWRIEGTLREFPRFDPVNLWFDYPVHTADESGVLGDLESEGKSPPYKKASEKRRKEAGKKRLSKQQEIEDAVNNANTGEPPTLQDMIDYMSTGKDKPVPERTMRDWVKKFGFYIDRNDGTVRKNE